MKIDAQTSNTAKVIGISTFVLLLAGLVVYQRGKYSGKKEETKVVPVPLPDTDPEAGITDDVVKRVRAYALSLHEDLTEVFGIRNIDLYKRLVAENDNILIYVYNDFNQLYAGEKDGSLAQWLQDEMIQTNAMRTIIERFNGLNIK